MKILLLTLSVLTLVACGKKDDGGSAPARTNVNFNSLNSQTGMCVQRTVDGVIYFSRGYIDIEGKKYSVANPQSIDQAISLALSKGVIRYKPSNDVRFNAKFVAHAVSQQTMGPQMPTQGQYYGNTAPTTSQCNSSILNLVQVTITKQL
jgi:hypothetical protein